MRVVVIGAGEVGRHLATRLSAENHDVVVIDRDPKQIAGLEKLDLQTCLGTGSNPDTLLTAEAGSAEMIVAVTDSDEANMVACLFANTLNPTAKKIARVRSIPLAEHQEIVEKLDISLVINPEVEVARVILKLFEVPGAVDVVDLAGGLVKLIGVKVPNRSDISGLSLAQISNRVSDDNFLVAAICRDDRLIIPHGDDKVVAGDLLYLIVQPDHLPKTLAYFSPGMVTPKRFVIIGGGAIGYQLAKALENSTNHLLVVDSDRERCGFLSENLNRATIIHGDGTDQDLLREENIGRSDTIVAVTNDEEKNVLISLLAQRLGALQSITRISKFSYLPLVHAVGLERVVSPRISAANAILQYIRKGKVLSVTQIQGEEAEVIEFQAMDTSEIVDKPISSLKKFPQDAIIGAIVRNSEMIVPKGDSIIKPGDSVVVLARRDAIKAVEKSLVVHFSHF